MNNVNVFDILREKLNQNVNESIKDFENFKSNAKKMGLEI